MAVTLRVYPVFQALNDGVPISGGRVYTYTAGGTTTRSTTYADSRLKVPNKNPIVLDSRGEARIFSTSTHYIVIKDFTDTTTLHTEDNLAFGRDPVIPLTDDEGADLVSGLLGTYTAGSSTERVTFADPDELVTNANPAVADSEGIVKIYSGVGQNFKYVLKDSKERLIWTVDDIPVGNSLQYFGDNGGNLWIGGGYEYVKSLAGGTAYFYPSARSDDGYYCAVSGVWDTTYNYIIFGRGSGTEQYHCFVRFNNVTIPQGSTITAANITCEDYSFGYLGTTVNVNVYFEDADNPTAPTSGADFMSRTKTAAVAWNDVPEGSYGDLTYTSPDISSILQTVVNRPGFSSGNSIICYIFENNSTATNIYRAPRSIDAVLAGQGGHYVQLYVEWS